MANSVRQSSINRISNQTASNDSALVKEDTPIEGKDFKMVGVMGPVRPQPLELVLRVVLLSLSDKKVCWEGIVCTSILGSLQIGLPRAASLAESRPGIVLVPFWRSGCCLDFLDSIMDIGGVALSLRHGLLKRKVHIQCLD